MAHGIIEDDLTQNMYDRVSKLKQEIDEMLQEMKALSCETSDQVTLIAHLVRTKKAVSPVS